MELDSHQAAVDTEADTEAAADMRAAVIMEAAADMEAAVDLEAARMLLSQATKRAPPATSRVLVPEESSTMMVLPALEVANSPDNTLAANNLPALDSTLLAAHSPATLDLEAFLSPPAAASLPWHRSNL